MNFHFNGSSETIVYLIDKAHEPNCPTYSFLKNKKLFEANKGEVYTLNIPEQNSVAFVGLDEADKLTIDNIRLIFFKIARALSDNKISEFTVKLEKISDLCFSKTVKAACEGLLQATYKWDKYLSDKKPVCEIENVYFDIADDKVEKAEKAASEAEKIMSGVFLARNLINESAMYLYPETLANIASEELSKLGVKVTVLGKAECEKLGMHAFLSVSAGSDKEPKFIIMEYNGAPASTDKIALVGKGLTYDSGGYCIKTPGGMATMHCDMGGAGSVVGAIKAIAENKLEKNVIGVIAACENMINGSSYKTGDIISSMAGKTIEVLNTDAEGRITLADSLYYAASVIKPNAIVDLATLTGACVSALGCIYTGAVTNNDELLGKVMTASKEAGEKIWQLPSDDAFRDMLKSDFADLKNVTTKGAGTITAGMFLENFVCELPWVHLDIAGTAYIDAPDGYLPKGATANPVKTLYEFVKAY